MSAIHLKLVTFKSKTVVYCGNWHSATTTPRFEVFVFLQNQTGSLGGFLPLLMGGGVLSGLAQKDRISPEAFHPQPQPEHSRVFSVVW